MVSGMVYSHVGEGRLSKSTAYSLDLQRNLHELGSILLIPRSARGGALGFFYAWSGNVEPGDGGDALVLVDRLGLKNGAAERVFLMVDCLREGVG